MAEISDNSSASMAAAVARARLLMLISAATSVVAIGAVAAVIGYRVFAAGGSVVPLPAPDGVIALPKGARVMSTAASAGRIAVLIELDGGSELRTFDIKTLRETGRVRFSAEP
jgi:hypothetical protein